MDIIRVSKPSLDQMNRVKPLLEKTDYKPYRFLRSELQDELTSFWLHDIVDLSSRNNGEIFCAMDGSKVLGMIVYTDLPWETEIFGKKMGTLKYIVVDPSSLRKSNITEKLLLKAIEWAAGSDIEFLLCKTYTDDIATIHGLEKHGFLIMDTLLDYVYDYRSSPLHTVAPPRLFKGAEIRVAEDTDLDELVTVAHASFQNHFGRFHADEKISKDQAVRVYEEWIKSSCSGYADWILVAEVGGRIKGYSVMKKPSPLEQALKVKVGQYNIGGVHPDHQGLGLFGAMSYEVMRLFNGKVDCILGSTHINNYSLQQVLTKLIWRICDARHSFHKWLTI